MKRLNIAISDVLHARLKTHAKELEISRTEIIRRALMIYVPPLKDEYVDPFTQLAMHEKSATSSETTKAGA